MQVIPKTVAERYNGQRVILRFCPDATEESKRWSWQVTITREYTYSGTALSEARARNQARKMIEDMIGSPEAKKVV